MKILINTSIGCYILSDKVVELYIKKKGMKVTRKKDKLGTHYYLENGKYFYATNDIERNDPILIKVVEELGEKANRKSTTLEIIKIPNNVEYWEIKCYDDGTESVKTIVSENWS